jgi:hypothetical protein
LVDETLVEKISAQKMSVCRRNAGRRNISTKTVVSKVFWLTKCCSALLNQPTFRQPLTTSAEAAADAPLPVVDYSAVLGNTFQRRRLFAAIGHGLADPAAGADHRRSGLPPTGYQSTSQAVRQLVSKHFKRFTFLWPMPLFLK